MIKSFKMDLSSALNSDNISEITGVKMADNLADTLKINVSRVNKNTGKYYTSTLIIFSYVKMINETELTGELNKNKYISTAKSLLEELKGCGFEVGSDWRDNNKLPYSKGNKKLSKDTIIINLSPASLCISKNLGLCDVCGICYALSSERRYINTLIYRLTQLIRFEELTAEEIASQFYNMRVIRWLRINEAGDVFNMDDILKLKKIARLLFDKKGVYTYIYTHREDIWDEIKSHQTSYFKVNRSMIDFNPSPKVNPSHNSLYCDGECNYCVYCKIELNTPITALYHGDLIGEDLRDVKTKKRDLILKWECFKMFEAGADVDEIKSHITSTLSPAGGVI